MQWLALGSIKKLAPAHFFNNFYRIFCIAKFCIISKKYFENYQFENKMQSSVSDNLNMKNLSTDES